MEILLVFSPPIEPPDFPTLLQESVSTGQVVKLVVQGAVGRAVLLVFPRSSLLYIYKQKCGLLHFSPLIR